MVFPLDDDSVGSTPITSDDVPLSVTGERGSGKRKCSRSSLPPSLLNAARRRVTKSCELPKLDGVDVSCEISSRCPCVLVNLSRIGAAIWLFTFLMSWLVGPTIDSDTQWISYPTYSRKLRVFDADASTTSLIPVVGWVFLLGRSSMLLI